MDRVELHELSAESFPGFVNQWREREYEYPEADQKCSASVHGKCLQRPGSMDRQKQSATATELIRRNCCVVSFNGH